ncbi:phage coat protein, partial [Vibrio parahaemolyticus]|nr:phage coat protein [Vibrio parahaemolyticus]
FSAIDLSGVAVKIGAAGLLIVGITMAYKSITLAKRAVNKA